MSNAIMTLTASVNVRISYFTADGDPILRICTVFNPSTNEQIIYYHVVENGFLVYLTEEQLSIYRPVKDKSCAMGARLVLLPPDSIDISVESLIRRIRPTQLATPSHLGALVTSLVKHSPFKVLHVTQVNTYVTCYRQINNFEFIYPELTTTLGEPKKIRRERAIYAEVKVTEDSLEVIRFFSMSDIITSKENVIVRISDSTHLHYHFYCPTVEQQKTVIALGLKVADDLGIDKVYRNEPSREFIRYSTLGLSNAHKCRSQQSRDLQQVSDGGQ